MFNKVLISNRGEIAVRAIRALKEMEIESVVLYSDVDKDSYFVNMADYAYALNGNKPIDTYMNVEKIIKFATDIGVDAIYPGYGFISEREKFAKAVEKTGITFIGPQSNVLGLMGDKIAARDMVKSLGIPVVRGSNNALSEIGEAIQIAKKIGYPILIKASSGGGGMGMKVAYNIDELEKVFKEIQVYANTVLGDNSLFVEKYIESPRHIEVQVVADKYGNIIYLGERECSIQRRYQKIVEETPSLIITDELREEMGNAAVKIAKGVKYDSVGTVEFIYDNGKFYFLEMNTRIQVEHTITEMITGFDIVKSQIAIAAGEKLDLKQEDIEFNGHAIEVRICSEDPLNKFTPSVANIEKYVTPGGFGVRLDSGIILGSKVSHYYDSILAKLVTWGKDRDEAITRMKRALDEFIIKGPKTTIPFLYAIMNSKAFKEGKICTKFIEKHPHLFDETKMYLKKNNNG